MGLLLGMLGKMAVKLSQLLGSVLPFPPLPSPPTHGLFHHISLTGLRINTLPPFQNAGVIHKSMSHHPQFIRRCFITDSISF